VYANVVLATMHSSTKCQSHPLSVLNTQHTKTAITTVRRIYLNINAIIESEQNEQNCTLYAFTTVFFTIKLRPRSYYIRIMPLSNEIP